MSGGPLWRTTSRPTAALRPRQVGPGQAGAASWPAYKPGVGSLVVAVGASAAFPPGRTSPDS